MVPGAAQVVLCGEVCGIIQRRPGAIASQSFERDVSLRAVKSHQRSEDSINGSPSATGPLCSEMLDCAAACDLRVASTNAG